MYKTAFWYVVHTHPKQEIRVYNNFSTLGIESFVPQIKKRQAENYTNKIIYKIKPLFPGYVFAQFDVTTLLHKVRLTRGVHSVVSYGTNPAQVDSWIITTIQARVGEDGYVRIGEILKRGDEVIIEDGLLKDFGGIFERETGDAERVMILLRTVSYQAHLVIEREMVKKAVPTNCR